MIMFSWTSSPRAKRSSDQRAKSGLVTLVSMCSARSRPITGAIMNPWPMNPHARVGFTGSATGPTMGPPSGVRS